MTDMIKTDSYGMLTDAVLNGQTIRMRPGEYAGPSWRIRYAGETWTENNEAREAGGAWMLNFQGLLLARRVIAERGELIYHLEAENAGSQPFFAQSLGVQLGIDTYMARFPEWNEQLFPTMLRAERTHFYGYFRSPSGKTLAVACEKSISSWTMHYNRMFSNCGHRVEGVTLELLCAGALPERQMQRGCIMPGEHLAWNIRFRFAGSIDEALSWASRVTGAPVFSGERLIFEAGERAQLRFYSPATICAEWESKRVTSIPAEDGSQLLTLSPAREGRAYVIRAEALGKEAEVRAYWRREWSYYLKAAASEALRCPQKASSHVESWYGYFSGLLAMRYLPNEARDNAILKSIDDMIPLVYDLDNGAPTLIPGRIQNTAGLVSILTDAWQATGDVKWLTRAAKLADHLIDTYQGEDGAFRSGSGVHYTCVLYIAKSIQELWLEERKLRGLKAHANKHFAAVKRAIDELVCKLDDIGTEGEMTFEDGMISCSFSQIAYFALYLDAGARTKYIDAAQTLYQKHRCLERMGSPDCRSRNTTIRYWEAQYDVLIPANMISSPHGWSAWKAYGVWYLYLLTGNDKYLTDVMELLGSCAQLLSEDGKMRWGFAVDPQINTCIFKNIARLYPATFGECYIDMISDWYKAPKNTPVFGYQGVYEGFSTDQGGCCDNDVHEWVKAMCEIALPYAYIYETDEGLTCVNARITDEDPLTLAPGDNTIIAVHVRMRHRRNIRVNFLSGMVERVMAEGWLKTDGGVSADIPDGE